MFFSVIFSTLNTVLRMFSISQILCTYSILMSILMSMSMSMAMAMLGYILDVTGPLELGPAALTNHSPPEVSTVSSMKRQKTVGTLDLGSNMSQT